jgi:hypothetical protein
MSDYFGALLRSSGTALPQVSGSARPGAVHAAPAGALAADQPPLPSAPSSDAIGGPAPQPTLLPAPLAVQPVTASIESRPASAPGRDAIADGAAHNARTTASAPIATTPLATAADEGASRAAQSQLGRALIDAALRWVAAGEAADRRDSPADEPARRFTEGSAPAASQPEPSPSRIEKPIARIAPTIPRSGDTTPLPVAPLRDTAPLPMAHARDAANPAVVHEGSISLPQLRSEMRSNAAAAAAALERDPPLDVSIGAIHVRVDAPGAQTVTQAAAPRQAAAPHAPSGRSGLARRALRRI